MRMQRLKNDTVDSGALGKGWDGVWGIKDYTMRTVYTAQVMGTSKSQKSLLSNVTKHHLFSKNLLNFFFKVGIEHIVAIVLISVKSIASIRGMLLFFVLLITFDKKANLGACKYSSLSPKSEFLSS